MLTVEYRPLDKLIPYARNARTHSPEQVAQIAASIKEFGFNNPILVDGDNGVIAGHGRLLAAQKLGLDKVPCIELSHLTEAQKRAYILADNKLAENAGWDKELLKIELQDLNLDKINLDAIGFSELEIDNLLKDINTPEKETEDIAPQKQARCSLGEVYILGGHKLMCGDATKDADVQTLTGGVKPNLYLTDPPYNVAYTGKTADSLKIKNDSMEDSAFRAFLTDAFTAANTVLQNGAAFYIWHADSEGLNFRAACKAINWQIRECLIWAKNSFVLGRQDYQWQHEPCLYGWKDGAPHNWYSDRKQTTVIECDRPIRNGEHPTMKPVELFKYLIKNSTKREDAVLDTFAGSGTTLIACEDLHRHAYCMELDPVYCDVIINRWQKMTGQKAKRIDGVCFDDLPLK